MLWTTVNIRINFYFNIINNFGCNITCSKTCMSSCITIKWRYSYKAVYSFFTVEADCSIVMIEFVTSVLAT